MPAGHRRVVEGTAVVVAGRTVAPEEEGLRTELAVRRTAKEPALHKALAVVGYHRAARMEREEPARHMVAEKAAVGGNSQLVVVVEEDTENVLEEDIDLEGEVVGNSPGCLPAALPVVSVLNRIICHLDRRYQVLLTAVGWIVWIRHYGELFRYSQEIQLRYCLSLRRGKYTQATQRG
jgi:hypothetical protein